MPKGLPYQEKRWLARANYLFYWAAGMGLLSAIPFDPSTGRIDVVSGGMAAVLTAVIGWLVTRRKLVAVAGLVVGGGLLAWSIPLWRNPSGRMMIGLRVSAALGVALLVRRRHIRRVVSKAEVEQHQMPPDLATSVRKAGAEAESHARASFAERWLMMHALVATAADPSQVKLEDIPGGPSAAAA